MDHSEPAGRRKGKRSTRCLLLFSILCSSVALASAAPPTRHEVFTEDLLLRSLPDGRLHASFTFTTLSFPSKEATNATRNHHELLPRTLMQIAHVHDAHSLHLALNTGRWNYAKWGWPTAVLRGGKKLGEEAVGAGAEIWSRLRKKGSREYHDIQAEHKKALPAWRGLTASLAGLFCASLDAVDGRTTVTPELGFGAQLPLDSTLAASTTLLHAFLPTESICTENLTPFLKLLPCRASAGLASLLRPHEVFGSDFHGMAIHLERTEPEGELSQTFAGGWKLELKFQAVFSPALSGPSSKRDWSLSTIFGQPLLHSCPLASSSNVIVTRPADPSSQVRNDQDGTYLLQPIPIQPTGPIEPVTSLASRQVQEVVEAPSERNEEELEEEEVETYLDVEDEDEKEERHREALSKLHASLQHEGSVVYDTRNLESYGGSLDVNITWPSETAYEHPRSIDPPALLASRSLTGHGQERGHIELQVRNNDISRERSVLYVEQLPWYVVPLLHTLTATVSEDVPSSDDAQVVRFVDDLTRPLLRNVSYQSSVPRTKPFLLEARLRVPASATLRLAFEYDKAFLRYAEHPPDAHRGFDLPPAVLEVLDEEGGPDFVPVSRLLGSRRKETTPRIYTMPGLVEVAVPDFSMPYNVIIMTSTVIALFFGSAFNNLIRNYQDVRV